MFPDWNYAFIAVSASFHSVAILCTLFRLWYQFYTTRMWWDDGWATLALLADVSCLVVTALEQPIPNNEIPLSFKTGNWIFSLAYPILMWAVRISILTSIVRVLHPEGTLRRIILGIGILFGFTGIAVLALRLSLCVAHACLITKVVLVFQILSECIADVILSVLPIWLLRSMKLDQKRRVLITSAFSATMVIVLVTVVEAVVLLRSSFTSGSIVFEHVKVACAMIVCNLLVIAAYIYCTLRKGNVDMEDAIPSKAEFTTVDLDQAELSEGASGGQLTSSTMTKSSSWSFQGSQSRLSRSIVTVRIDMERVEECE